MYHFVPQSYYDSLDPNADYVPSDFEREKFIHCTDERAEMAQVANRLFGAAPGRYLYLYIDRQRVRAPILYDDANKRYPHIYGSLNRDAILEVRPASRDAEGKFLPPGEGQREDGI